MESERIAWVRRNVIAALCSDDELMEQLVLKGGNALNLVHNIGGRTSLDIDYSLESDFKDVKQAESRVLKALRKQFRPHNLVVIDFKFELRGMAHLSGYHVDFKLASDELFERAKNNPAKLTREAETVAPGQVRKVEIEISKHEYCGASEKAEIPGLEIPLAVRVYTPEMIVAEKFRSICQQMPQYRSPNRATARARDFYDIRAIVTQRNIDLATRQFHDLIRECFRAKKVPLDLLGKIAAQRGFHSGDWAAVTNTVRGGVRENFDSYFDFTLQQAEKLKPLWIEDSP